jgi:hypothetical protein
VDVKITSSSSQLPLNGLLPLHLIRYLNHGCSGCLHEYWNYFFNYWRKCLVIVFSLLLGESSGHNSIFVHCNMLDLLDQSWKSTLTSLLVSRKNPYLSLSDWLPSLSLKQGNLPRRFHISFSVIGLSWHLSPSLGRCLFI